MSIEIIPNQPILFRPSEYDSSCGCCGQEPCMLVGENDSIYAQIKMTGCGDEMICGQPVIGSELVVNGNFLTNANGWTTNGGWTWAAGELCSDELAADLEQVIVGSLAGRSYRLTYTIRGGTGGNIAPELDGIAGATQNTIGTFTDYFTITNNNATLKFINDISFDRCIDDISLVQYFPCWGESDAVGDAAITYSTTLACVSGTISLSSGVVGAVDDGTRYVVTFTISNYVSGTVYVQLGSLGTPSENFSGNGQKYFYERFLTGTSIYFIFTDFIGCISDISIKLLVAPVFTVVDVGNGDSYSVSNSYITYKDDRAILKLIPKNILPYGCYKICLFDACGFAEFIADNVLLNPTFQSELAGWTLGDGWTLENQAHYLYDGSSSLLSQVLESTAIRCTKINVTAINGDGASLGFSILNGSDTVDNIVITEAGIYSLCGLMNKVQIAALGGVGFEYIIDYAYSSPIADCDDCTSGYFCSNCFQFNESFPCAPLLESYNDENDSFGFVWNNASGANIFKLSHRLEIKLNNPKYPEESVDYTFSTGETSDTFAQSEKTWQLFVNKTGETQHDVVRLQKRADHFVITDNNESAEYFAEKGDYNPEWIEPDGSCVAPARFRVKKKLITLFNNLC